MEEKQYVSESYSDGSTGSGKWTKVLRFSFVILSFFFLCRYFYRNIDTYRNLEVHIDSGVFFIAFIFHLIYKIMQALLWHYITILNNCGIKIQNAVLTYFYSILGKYIPGKVFMLLARIPAYEDEGVSASKVTVCFFVENVCTLLGAAFLFIVSLLFIPNNVFTEYRWCVALVIFGFAVCINPRIINFFLRIVEKFLKKSLQIPMSYGQMIKVVTLFVLNWIVLGVGFYMLICSIYPIEPSNLLYVSGVFGLSVIIGILALFAPSGLGVREGVMILGLSAVMPQEYAVLISVVSRLWMTISELITVGLAWLIGLFIKRRTARDRGDRS